MDVRGQEQAQRVTATGDAILRYVGDIESPEWMIPKAIWIRENEPEVYDGADRIRNPLARGVIWGLALKHSRAHVSRAIYEGIAYGTRYILEDLATAGFDCSKMYACGGGTTSELWM
jgi:ribulose kinase